jgi:hypothetical protein
VKVADEWTMAICDQAEKPIGVWNDKANKGPDSEGLWYHPSHIANELDWKSKKNVKQYTGILETGFQKYIALIDLQFRVGKLLILLTNIIAGYGHESWQDVFHPYGRKNSLQLNALIHDEFVLDTRMPVMDEFGRLLVQDSMKPFRDSEGKIIEHKGRRIVREEVSENEEIQIERMMQDYRSQPADLFKRMNLEGFELNAARDSPDYYGSRILLDEASSLVYRAGGYIAAPSGQRVKVDHQRLITLVYRMNDFLYPDETREDYPYEERFMLPICRKLFPKILEKVQLEYDCVVEESEFADGYRSPYLVFSTPTTTVTSPRADTSKDRTSVSSGR